MHTVLAAQLSGWSKLSPEFIEIYIMAYVLCGGKGSEGVKSVISGLCTHYLDCIVKGRCPFHLFSIDQTLNLVHG